MKWTQEENSMKLTKLTAAAALLCTALFAGCAAPQKVTEENAPTDLMKKAAVLTSESSASDVLDVLNQIINTTAEEYNYKIALNQSTDASSLTEDEENGIKAEQVKTEIYDVRYAGDKTVYELFEQQSGEDKTAGLMLMSNTLSSTVFADFETGKPGDLNAELKVSSVQNQENEDDGSSDEDLTAVVQNTVIYPLYTFCGQSLILQPNVNPEYYDFSLTRIGDAYTLTMKMKDHDAYNEYLDTFVQENYGYERADLKGDGSLIVEEYDTTELTISLTMNENGVLSEIVNNNVNKIGEKASPLNIYSKQTVKIAAAPERFDTFFTEFFNGVKDSKIKEGNLFSVEKGLIEEPAADTSKDDANKDDASKDDASKENTDQKDAASDDKAGNSDQAKTEEESKPAKE